MTRRLNWGLALLGLLWTAGAVGARLSMQVDRAVSPLGAPITLSFAAQGLPLEQLDLRPLARDFDLGAENFSQSGDHQSLSLPLYPLHTGRIVLPVLKLGAARMRPLAVEVEAGSSLVPAVTTRLSVEPAQPMVRQPARLVLEIQDDGSLLWQRPVLPTGDGLFQEPAGETEVQTKCNGARCTVHRYVWNVMATRAGPLALRLPMLAASKFGTALRFPPPPLQFTARPSPAWLPLGVPVGPLQIAADPLTARWPLHRPLAWTFTVQGGLGAEELRHLLALQLAAFPQLAAYPPAVERLAHADDPAPVFTLRAQIYLRPDRSGVFHLPSLVFPWFDPARGALQTAILPGRDIRVFNPIYPRLTRGAAYLAAALAALLAGRWAQRYVKSRLARRRCLRAVSHAADAAALSHAVRRCAWWHSSMPETTLGEWWKHLPSGRRTSTLARHVRALEAMAYGVRSTDLNGLKEGLLGCLRRM